MAAPTPAQLADLLGASGVGDGVGELPAEQAQAALDAATAFAAGYTRGRGFINGVPAEDIRYAILMAAARIWRHPAQLEYMEVKGPESISFRGGFEGFTLAERYILNRHRITAL